MMMLVSSLCLESLQFQTARLISLLILRQHFKSNDLLDFENFDYSC
jgi:hypothetical protein